MISGLPWLGCQAHRYPRNDIRFSATASTLGHVIATRFDSALAVLIAFAHRAQRYAGGADVVHPFAV